MDKTGRNEPCPCGSGKKYKKWCLPMHEADERQRLAEQQADREQRAREVRTTIARELASFEDEIDELTAASNAVIDLVHTGKLDEAEQAARDLLARFPDVHDGYDRLGMVYDGCSPVAPRADRLKLCSFSLSSSGELCLSGYP